MTPHVEIILMVYKSRHVLPKFLASVGAELPIILVDNSYQEDDVSDLLTEYPNVRRINAGGNIGFSAAANFGAKASSADVLVFMNPDTEPSPASLLGMARYLDDNPEVAACGAAGDGTAGGGALPTAKRVLAHTLGLHRRQPLSGLYYQDVAGKTVDVDWIAGSCMAIRRELYESIGGFDPEYFIYMSDFDLGHRLRQAGHRQVIVGEIVVPHDDGGSSDLPAIWTWERRGRAWTRFLRRSRPPVVALGLSAALVAGYTARFLLYTVTRKRNRAVELRTYTSALIREWIRPTSAWPTQ
jgi:GT2 family glycosyltransferase